MTMSPDHLLQYLPPFTGRKEMIKVDQSVPDIIKEICAAHIKYKKHYQLIYPYFIGSSVKGTARNVWNFLKKNSDYVIEPDSLQTVKTPAAILATAPKRYGGNDCKNLALFSAGILDAYRQATGQDFDIYFRFAGYRGRDISHVFTVVKQNGTEIWVDPVLNEFDSREHIPTKYKDKKIEKMALVGLSGVNPYENDKAYFQQQENPVPGYAVFGPSDNPPAQPSDKPKLTTQQKIELGVKIAQALQQLFGKKDAPGDYWKAWEQIDMQYGNPIGASAQHWIIFDGDSIQNEALNIISYIQNVDQDLKKILSPNATTMRDAGRYVTIDDLISKLNRGGFSSEASKIRDIYNKFQMPPDQPTGSGGTTKAGINMLITVGLAGAALFFLLKQKR